MRIRQHITIPADASEADLARLAGNTAQDTLARLSPVDHGALAYSLLFHIYGYAIHHATVKQKANPALIQLLDAIPTSAGITLSTTIHQKSNA